MEKTLFTYSSDFGGKMKENITNGTGVKIRWSLKDVQSCKVPTSAINRRQAQAIDTKVWNVVRGLFGYGQYEIALYTAKDCGFAEVYDKTADETTVVKVQLTNDIYVFHSFIADDNGVTREYDAKNRRGSAYVAALIAKLFMVESEVQAAITDLKSFAPLDEDADDWDDILSCEVFGKTICLLCQNMYYETKERLDLSSHRLRESELKALTGVRVLFGTPKYVNSGKSANASVKIKVGEYIIDKNRIFSEEEKALIPQMPETYVFPEWVKSVCADIQDSTIFSQPFRNILLTGPSGTGKTKGSQAIAFALGLPYVKITCSPDTDMFDLIGQLLPNTEGETVSAEEALQATNLPSFDDVENDYEATFKRLFGRKPSKVDSPADCYNEILSRFMKAAHSSKDFTYVESDFIRGIKNGWLVEIQEPTVIKKQSVLVGLNAVMENDSDTAFITLPTGKTIKRHPQAVVVMSTNSDYAGCQSIQQSVLSRIDIVREIENPELSVLVERTMKQTGCCDKNNVETMARMMQDISTYCTDKDITDGVCGPRELQNWVKAALIQQRRFDGENAKEIGKIHLSNDSIVYSAFSTFLKKCSQDIEGFEEVLTSCFQKQFNESLVQEAKNAYLVGNC